MIGGTREAIQNALAYAYLGNTITGEFTKYLCPITRSPANPAVMLAYSVQLAKIRAAISEQPSPVRNWIYLCYGPDVEAMQKHVKKYKLAAHILSVGRFGPVGDRRKARLERMAPLSLEDARMGILMNRDMPQQIYCDQLGVQASNWHRDRWHDNRREMLRIIMGFDAEGIAKVSMTVKKIRETADPTELELSNMLKKLSEDNNIRSP